MKKIYGLIFLLSAPLQGVEVKVTSVCNQNKSYVMDFDLDAEKTILDYSIELLDSFLLDYQAYDNGISSIFNSPTATKALEILPNNSLRSYGWCFLTSSVKGLPAKMPNEIVVTNQHEKIHWFYAYAESQQGRWVKFCEPVYKSKPKFICKQ